MRVERGPDSSRSQSARSTKLSSPRCGVLSFGVAPRGTSAGGVFMRGEDFGEPAFPFRGRWNGLIGRRSSDGVGSGSGSGSFDLAFAFGRVMRSGSTSFGLLG